MRIGVLIIYFGEFPPWAELYFETLRRNSSIDFIFFTDADMTSFKGGNIRHRPCTLHEYTDMVRKKLNVDFKPANAYKICDIRPMYGYLHKEELQEYDIYGWTDMDILFGDIRSFYTDDILKRYEVFSSHSIRISGHFALFKNTDRNRGMYKRIYSWKKHVEDPEFVGIDEHGITNAYCMTWADRFNEKFGFHLDNALLRKWKAFKARKLYMKEQYSTPFTAIPWLDGSLHSQQPDTWYYVDGLITNSRDKDLSFMYLHLMNFRSSTWRHDGTKAPWAGKHKVFKAGVQDMKRGIVIDSNGIQAL